MVYSYLAKKMVVPLFGTPARREVRHGPNAPYCHQAHEIDRVQAALYDAWYNLSYALSSCRECTVPWVCGMLEASGVIKL